MFNPNDTIERGDPELFAAIQSEVQRQEGAEGYPGMHLARAQAEVAALTQRYPVYGAGELLR